MAARKTKKIVTPEKDVEVPVNFAYTNSGDFVKDLSELERAQEKCRHEFEGVPAFDGCTDAPYDRTADTDIQKRVQDEIDTLYPRTRVGIEGILDAVLRELIRARLIR